MKNNYKQLMSKSPSESSVFKRSASHSLRSSFRLPKKRMSLQTAPSCSSLPSYVPPKAAALLQISMPTSSLKQSESLNEVISVRKFPEPMKVATIRRRSVWANSSAKISLPSSQEDDREERFQRLPVNQIFDVNRMHIGGFNLNKNIQQSQADTSETMNDGSSILKEINKNTSAEHFKVSKKHKLGHGAKRPEINVLCALFEIIENNQAEKLKSLLEKDGGQVHINTLNNDGLSPLDVAVLLENHAIVKVLLQYGANAGFDSNDSIEAHVNTLLLDSEQKLYQLTTGSGASSSGPSGLLLDFDKQKSFYEKRAKLLRKMVSGWQNLQIPDSPISFSVDVVGNNSVLIKILQPIENSICTKVKVQYSSREDFSIIIGEKIIADWKDFEGTMGVNFQLNNLIQGRRYFFRASSGNFKGFGSFKSCNPRSIVPSSWRDLNESDISAKSKSDQKETFEKIFNFIKLSKREDHQEDASSRRNSKKKTTIKQLFTAASKFQKTLKRGIHLACICFTDDKVLVTNEDVIPVIEIDDTYPNSLNNDFYWLMKISMSWDCVKELKDDMEKNAMTKVQFRCKILNAIYQMQMALGTTDLGRFYYKPLKDSDGTVVLSCILNVKEQKSSMNLRWIPLLKLQKKVTVLLEDTSTINEILLNSISTQINFHQASRQKLSKGLYLGYLKMFSSFDTIQIVCQAKNPNVLPNCKIRDNPHVSAEEWSALQPKEAQKANAPLCFDLEKYGSNLSDAQQIFVDSLKLSLNRLFKYMNVSSETAFQHRLYDLEVVELDADVTFLLICSPLSENAILTKDFHSDRLDLSLKRNDLLCLPLIVHEMLQFNVYQHETIKKYARLSFLVEFEIIVANLKHREAFSNNEIQIAKEKLKKLQDVMNDLNGAWKGVRWMMDAINFSRTKEQSSGVDVKTILQFNNTTLANDLKTFKQPLQPAPAGFHLTSPIRGSWSGPQNYALKNSEIFMYGEHSKSEQVLNSCEARVPTLASCDSLGRQSTDSNYYSSGEKGNNIGPRLPSSRSEDTLVVIRNKGTTNNGHQRKRATTINTNSSAESSEGHSSKSNGLIVHRINNTQFTNEPFDHPPSIKVEQSPSKNRLRVSHHPKANVKKEIKKFVFESNEESTLVTFLKPTLTAIQNESQNCSFKDPLLIVEDEAIEMISSPFRKAPVEHKSNLGKVSAQFIRSNLHSKNVHAICQEADTEPDDWRAVGFFKKIEDAGETKAFTSSKSDFEAEENLVEREYVNQSSVLENNSSILHVIAAYQTGLASGTSLKLKCQPKTTAKEVIELVVKQLNMAVIMKGKEGPIYDAEKLDDFCLVAVIGARERCLRPDFKPLDLQNPWKKGKLFVRLKHDLLAAIEHSNRETFSL